jgi:hypothetical protein
MLGSSWAAAQFALSAMHAALAEHSSAQNFLAAVYTSLLGVINFPWSSWHSFFPPTSHTTLPTATVTLQAQLHVPVVTCDTFLPSSPIENKPFSGPHSFTPLLIPEFISRPIFNHVFYVRFGVLRASYLVLTWLIHRLQRWRQFLDNYSQTTRHQIPEESTLQPMLWEAQIQHCIFIIFIQSVTAQRKCKWLQLIAHVTFEQWRWKWTRSYAAYYVRRRSGLLLLEHDWQVPERSV